MKTFTRSLAVISFALVLALGTPIAQAAMVTLFVDIPTYTERGKDIVIARCTSLAKISGHPLPDGLEVWEVEVVKVLKGEVGKGNLRVVSLYPLEPSKTYLLYSLGGSAHGSEFLAIPELSVVELPPEFDLAELKGKTVNEQVDTMMASRRDQVRREIERLERERNLLEKAAKNQKLPEGDSQATTASDSKPEPELDGDSQ